MGCNENFLRVKGPRAALPYEMDLSSLSSRKDPTHILGSAILSVRHQPVGFNRLSEQINMFGIYGVDLPVDEDIRSDTSCKL